MSSERTKEERRSAVLLPNNLALPNANRLVIHQGTIRIVLSTKRSEQFLQHLRVVRPGNSILFIILYVIPKPISATLSKIPHRFEETTKEPLLDALDKGEVKKDGRCEQYYHPLNSSLTLQNIPQFLHAHLKEVPPYSTDPQDFY